jgi:Tol biopolymer transport system component
MVKVADSSFSPSAAAPSVGRFDSEQSDCRFGKLRNRGASRICLLVTILIFCGCGSIRIEQWGRHVVGQGTSATWSPDGKSIAFLNHGELYVVRAKGRSAARDLTPGIRVWGFAWSPDSRNVAFGQVGSHDQYICPSGELGVVSADGKSATRILTSGELIPSFIWSPESREILCEVWYYAAPRDSNEPPTPEPHDSAELQVVDPGSGAARSLEGPWASSEHSTSLWRWLNDGNIALYEIRKPARDWRFLDRFGRANPRVTSKEKLFYVVYDSTPDRVWWMMNADGSERVRLAVPDRNDDKVCSFPVLSGVGKKLAVVTKNSGLFVTDLRGKSWVKLGDSLDNPQWSPDGRWLTCTQHLSSWPFGCYLLTSADGHLRTQIREPFVFAPVGNSVMYVTSDGTISTSRLWIHWWPFKASKAR